MWKKFFLSNSMRYCKATVCWQNCCRRSCCEKKKLSFHHHLGLDTEGMGQSAWKKVLSAQKTKCKIWLNAFGSIRVCRWALVCVLLCLFSNQAKNKYALMKLSKVILDILCLTFLVYFAQFRTIAEPSAQAHLIKKQKSFVRMLPPFCFGSLQKDGNVSKHNLFPGRPI